MRVDSKRRERKDETYTKKKDTQAGTEEHDGHRKTKQELRQLDVRMYSHIKWVFCQDYTVGL